MSGAVSQAQNVDIIANNLANSDTLGFKKDMPTFKEYLAIDEREKALLPGSPAPLKDKDITPLDGKDQSYVIIDGTHTNFRQGTIRVTQSPLDVALDGPGFFEVSTPSGVRYTRHGSFKMAMDGRLVTSDGFPVLSSQPGGLSGAQAPSAGASGGQSGQGLASETQGRVSTAPPNAPTDPTVAARFINLRDRGSITISPAGELFAGEDLVGKLSVVEFGDIKKVVKAGMGQQLFVNSDPANPQTIGRTEVRQGMIEASNVNPIEEMTNLIKANRLFEQDLKAMKTYGEMMGREANDVGKL